MSYKTSTQGNYYSQFTNDEKIAYALNLSLAKVTTDAFKSGYEWYKSPDLFNAISKQTILSESIPSYNDIKDYYCIITVGNIEYITNKTVDNILTYQGGFKLSDILVSSSNEILTGQTNEYSDKPTNSDFNLDGLCTKLPRQAFAYFVYWRNKLTGKGGNGNDEGSSGSGTWPDADDSLSLKLTLNSDGTNNTERTYDNTISNETLMNLLQTYTPLKIINPDYVTSYVTTNGVIDQTDGIPENLKQYILKNIAINVGVPTVSTWNGLSNSNNSDNIAFFNPLLTKSLNEPYGYNGNGLGNGYWIRGTDNDRTNIRPDYGSAAVGEGTMIFSAMTGFVLFFGVSNILENQTGVSVKNPPCVTALRYTGETFSDGIISQGDTLPSVEISNDKDLFINTTDNTIHRLEMDASGVKTWVGIGGSGGGMNALSDSSDNKYSQIIDYDFITNNDGENSVLLNYYDNSVDIKEWTKILDARYIYHPFTKRIIISYNAFVTFNSKFINNNLPGMGGNNGIMEWVICVGDDIITNSRTYVQIDLIEQYTNIRTIIDFTDNENDVDISKNIVKVDAFKDIKIYARSIYNNSDNYVRLHQTYDNLSRPDNLEVTSLSDSCSTNFNCKNIVDYKIKFLNIEQGETIPYSQYNDVDNINDNWSEIQIYDNYLPPIQTKSITLKFTLFATFVNDVQLGIRGNNAVIEFIFKLGDEFLPASRQFIHLDLIEKYFTIQTNIKLENTENLSKNILTNWDEGKNIKIYARSIYDNSNNLVKLHESQVVSSVKPPQIEIISLGGFDNEAQLRVNISDVTNSYSSNTNAIVTDLSNNVTDLSNNVYSKSYIDNIDNSNILYELVEYTFEKKKDLSSNQIRVGEKFGYSLANSGDFVVIGTNYLVNNDSERKVFIYKKDAGENWILEHDISNNDKTFGASVDIDGNCVVIGATQSGFNTGIAEGAAYVYERDPSGNWNGPIKLLPKDLTNKHHFGKRVSIHNNYIIVSADISGNVGAAYIFERDLSGNWGTDNDGSSRAENVKIIASDGSDNDFFGYSVSINGNYAIVGAPNDDDKGINSGSAYIFERDSNGNWGKEVSNQSHRTETKKIFASDGSDNEIFGSSVSINGNYFIVGDYGFKTTKQIYTYDNVGSAYIFQIKKIVRRKIKDDILYKLASESSDGLMSSSDKKKLLDLEERLTKIENQLNKNIS
jgi:hypothetical protein